MKKPCIGIIGSGNMAFCLGKGLIHSGFTICEIFSRNTKEGKKLAKLLSANYTSNISNLSGIADIYIFCLQDDVIHEVAKSFPFKEKLCIHTSGSVSIDIFKNEFNNCGVFYPVQSLNKTLQFDWSSIPICIEGSSIKNQKLLTQVAKKLSNSVVILDSERRKKLHLAAVFANNFSNACFQMSAEIIKESKIPFSILRPLISNTALKVQNTEPALVQTGPAIRHDEKVIRMQKQLLKDDKDLLKIYEFITKYIQSEE